MEYDLKKLAVRITNALQESGQIEHTERVRDDDPVFTCIQHHLLSNNVPMALWNAVKPLVDRQCITLLGSVDADTIPLNAVTAIEAAVSEYERSVIRAHKVIVDRNRDLLNARNELKYLKDDLNKLRETIHLLKNTWKCVGHCGECGDYGVVDSGFQNPDGSWIKVPCVCHVFREKQDVSRDIEVKKQVEVNELESLRKLPRWEGDYCIVVHWSHEEITGESPREVAQCMARLRYNENAEVHEVTSVEDQGKCTRWYVRSDDD